MNVKTACWWYVRFCPRGGAALKYFLLLINLPGSVEGKCWITLALHQIRPTVDLLTVKLVQPTVTLSDWSEFD